MMRRKTKFALNKDKKDMKRSAIKIAALMMLFSVAVLFSATASDKKNVKKIKTEALNYFETHQYASALHLYLQLDGKTKDDGMVKYMIGMCYLSSDEKDKALAYLLAAQRSERPSFVLNYYIGKAYLLQKNYYKAAQYLNIYYSKISKIDNIIFKAYDNVPQEHLVHYQKSANEVYNVIKFCETQLADQKSKDQSNLTFNR